MQSVNSEILLIGPWPNELIAMGCDSAKDLAEALLFCDKAKYQVVALSITNILSKDFFLFHKLIKERNKHVQLVVVVPKDFSLTQLIEIHNQYSFYRVLESLNDSNAQQYLLNALEEAQHLLQNEYLNQLIIEQSSKLKKLQVELEERVEKRTKHLVESRTKLFTTNFRLEAFKKILITVYQAQSLPEIEKTLSDALASVVQVSWIRILFLPQNEEFNKQVDENLEFAKAEVPLYSGHKQIGSIFFMRAPGLKYSKSETDFLSRVGEVVSVAVNRLNKLQQVQSIKNQWESTFNSVKDPLLIIGADYTILQSNKSTKYPEGEKCYKALFNQNSKCRDCRRGQNFQIDWARPERKTYEVNSQKILFEQIGESAGTGDNAYINVYHDITNIMLMQEKAVENAKLAELGTISSSIAHELNNPIGGVLNFAQLIKMDMDKSHELYSDIVEIERGALRCKEIIQNMLNYSRSHEADKSEQSSLIDACNMAIKILEIHTRAQGVEILTLVEENGDGIRIAAPMSLLSQSIKNLIKYFLESIDTKRVILSLSKGPEEVILKISNDSENIKNNNVPISLGLSVAKQIIFEVGGEIHWGDNEDPKLLAKISFPKPNFV